MHDWAVCASGSYLVALDNISNIPAWLSDALCRASTGDGFPKRALYTDDQVAVLAFRRVVVMTSIDPGAVAGDLGDRLHITDLERIDPKSRVAEADLAERWARVHPQLLGALYDLVADVLATFEDVTAARLPRMADYGRVLLAVDRRLGTDTLDRYLAQETRIARDVVDADLVASAVEGFMRKRSSEWTGTATKLLVELTPPERAPKGWPRTPQHLSGRLKRAAPALRRVGIHVAFDRADDRDRTRTLTISITDDDDDENDDDDPDHGDALDAGDCDRDDVGCASPVGIDIDEPEDENNSPSAASMSSAVADAPDDEDDRLLALSGDHERGVALLLEAFPGSPVIASNTVTNVDGSDFPAVDEHE